jgi:arginyl-tRNA synthetase
MEMGRLDCVPQGESVADFMAKRKNDANDVLVRLEQGDPEYVELWEITRQWSLNEFQNIYKWLGARFDHDFYESEVGPESKQLVMERYEKGEVFEVNNGAIGVQLEKYGMPFLVLIKSNGAGLYATKDLALAKRKFEQYNIQRSVYVVDAAQSLHFQQVFKTLELMGFENASKCFHLAYGLVVRPDGKMSSRKGTVIYFSRLKDMLGEKIDRDFLEKYIGEWSEEELEQARRAIAVGTIRYGMLNVDPSKDITFSLDDWAAKTGDTGPYLMYGYARIKSIQRRVPMPDGMTVDNFNPSLLTTKRDRFMMLQMTQFWPVIHRPAHTYKPHLVCKFLYQLSQNFMSWYEASPIISAETDELQCTRLVFITAIANLLKVGLGLLSIQVIERM